MTHILHVDASVASAEESHSRRLSAAFVDALRAKHPDATVTRRDVDAERLEHITDAFRTSWMAEVDRRTPEQKEIVGRSEALIDELRAADVIVIGSPMYNFTLPSTLKAWVDHVAVAGQTFRYTENGPQGLLAGKKAYLALSSGGVYTEGPASGMDHLGTYLNGLLGFLGMTDIETVRAEGVAMGPEKDAEAMKAAMARIDELVG